MGTLEIRLIESSEALSTYERGEELRRYAGEDPFHESPDSHLLVLREQEVVACCSLWWKDCPQLDGEGLGCLGHFFASDMEAGTKALEAAGNSLREAGLCVAVGPINGNTWRKYRFVSDAGTEPPFAMEPVNPKWWPELWTEMGFQPLAGYHSSLVELTSMLGSDPRIERAETRLEESGVRIRQLDLETYEQELKRIFSVSERSFVRNYLYSPITERAFMGMYLPLRRFVDSRFALLAECEGKAVGFVFAIPDLTQMQRGERCDTLIIKTLAVLPGRAWAGLGAVLVGRIQKVAKALGFKKVIHALMHDRNDSANIGKSNRIIRRYTLYAKRLKP